MERAETYLPAAGMIIDVPAPQAGFVGSIETRDIGVAVVALGGGRTRPQDPVDHAVGLTELRRLARASRRAIPLQESMPAREAAEQAIVAVLAA